MMKSLKAVLVGGFFAMSLVSAFGGHPQPKYHNPTPGEFPIVGWYAMPDSASTPERYREMREAGFNISFPHLYNNASVSRAVRAAKGTGVKIIAGSPHIETHTQESIDTLKNYPEIVGWFLRDEPVLSGFDYQVQFRDRVYAADTTRLVYLNLLPRMVDPKTLGTETYDDYLREFVKQIRLPMISYDMYPVHETADGEALVQPMLFTNLESARRVSREFEMPFWAFCLATAHTPYPVPRPSHLAVEAFSALAYGAQGIQYFTYWQPVSDKWNFHHSPIDKDGKRTDVYYMVRDLNREIQALAPIFLGVEAVDVWHTGDVIPDDTRRLSALPSPFESIESDGEGVLVSHLRNNGRQYLMVVNRDITNAQQVKIKADMSRLQQVMPDGSLAPASDSAPFIEPGRYVLYTFL